MYKNIAFNFLIIIATAQLTSGQQNEPHIYVDSLGQVYVKANVPAYLFIEPESNANAKILIPSNDPKTNPMVFDGNGIHYLHTQDAITKQPINFKIYADGIAPKVSIRINKGLLMSSGKRFYVDEGSTAELVAKDNYSGVKSIFVSVDGSEFINSKTLTFDKGNDYRVKAFAIDNVGNIGDTSQFRVISAVNSILKINNIYFDINSNRLRPDSKIELNDFVQVLNEYPEIRIEIRAHTDSQGDAEYNLELSEKRAEAVVNYLIQKGIYDWRLTFKGYGDTMPINECSKGVNCSDEKHQENRRVEFKILPIK